MSRLDLCRIINLPRVFDDRGNLTFFEGENHLPFRIVRAYWIYDVPGGEVRGGHAYRRLEEFVVSLSGSFDVEMDDGHSQRSVHLNRSYQGLYIPPMIWRRLKNFSTNSVCLIAASQNYDESDYLREYERFRGEASAP
jgi:dTDP-4-dehydrorhamnose 3,5-epimerase-like enzyme